MPLDTDLQTLVDQLKVSENNPTLAIEAGAMMAAQFIQALRDANTIAREHLAMNQPRA